jgi:hypothetical protein
VAAITGESVLVIVSAIDPSSVGLLVSIIRSTATAAEGKVVVSAVGGKGVRGGAMGSVAGSFVKA